MNRREFVLGGASALVTCGASGVATAEAGVGGLFRTKPHVQLLGERAFAAVWMTARLATGRLEWSQDGGRTWNRSWTATDGLRDANACIHKCLVKHGYDPTRPLAYRAVSRELIGFYPESVKYAGAEESVSGKIAPLVSGDGSVSLLMFNDIHERPDVFPALLSQVKDPVSFVVYAGDIMNSVESERGIVDALLTPMGDICQRLHAASWYVRGNHETRSGFARHLRDYLALPDGHFYGATTVGGVRMAFIDSGEDKEDDNFQYSGLVDFDGYLADQCAWLADEIASTAWREASCRIVVSHIPPAFESAHGGWRNNRIPRLEKLFSILEGANVSLLLGGHVHHHAFSPPQPGRPFPVVVGGGPFLTDQYVWARPTVTRCTAKDGVVTVWQRYGSGEEVFSRQFGSHKSQQLFQPKKQGGRS